MTFNLYSLVYCIAQKFNREILRQIKHAKKFDEQNFDEFIIGGVRIKLIIV